MKELEVTIRMRNNRLKERRDALGYTQAEMAMAAGVDKHSYGALECMSNSPLDKEGQWIAQALTIAEYLDCEIDELFPPSVLQIVLPSVTKKFDAVEMQLLLSDHSRRSAAGYEQHLLTAGEEESAVYLERRAVARLKPRDAEILGARFGMDGKGEKTFAEIAKKQGLSVQRTSDIVERSLGQITREIRKSRRDKNRFEICYLDVFEHHDVVALLGKLSKALSEIFPGARVWSTRKFWLPSPVEICAYGFRSEGIADVQAHVDQMVKSVVKAAALTPRSKPGRKTAPREPIEKVVPSEPPVVTLSFPSGKVTDHQVKKFVEEVAAKAIGGGSACVIVVYGDLKKGYSVAKHLKKLADRKFNRDIECWPEISASGRTILRLANDSSIDLVWEADR